MWIQYRKLNQLLNYMNTNQSIDKGKKGQYKTREPPVSGPE